MAYATVKLALVNLIVILRVSVLNSQNTSCNSRDLVALQDFLKGQEGYILGWAPASPDCCHWLGIRCSSNSGLTGSISDPGPRVVRLNLGRSQLKGLLPDSLANLDQLRVLNLSFNSFTGPLPPDLFNLQYLHVLDLSGNRFFGSIPATANLPSIHVFDISGNLFTGPQPLPPSGSRNLTKFAIGNNLFHGPIDASSLCNSSTKIQVLDLSSNRFSGRIPHGFGYCRSLTVLYLNSNNLFGSLPGDLFGMSSLRSLQIHGNRLSGQLDKRFRNLTNLVHLDVSENEFSGLVPGIFDSLTKLEHFSARSNNFSGLLPETFTSHPTVAHLDLRNNSFHGRINLNCTQLLHLRFLDLAFNQLKGPIPDHLSLCTELSSISLSGNKLEGQVPDSIKNIRTLSYLALSDNGLHNISRTLQILQQCENLTTLVLAGNFIGEEMPVDQIQGFEDLEVLSLPNCSLHGPVPSWLSNCTQLKVLDLSRNQLKGTIPSLIGGLKSLTYLNLSLNQLSGDIPIDVTELTSLIMANTPLILRNQRTEDLQYNEFFKLPPTIDLSSNQLVGPIWEEFGNLMELRILDLSFNHLSAGIPVNLSNLKNLEILDLSNNNLSGSIPYSLTNLSFLSWFSVANNHLEGAIPIGGQFSTFPNSSYEGNSRLCGEHFQSCDWQSLPPNSSPVPSDESGFSFEGLAFGLGAAAGFAVTLIVCALSGFYHVKRDANVGKLELSAWLCIKFGFHGNGINDFSQTFGSLDRVGSAQTMWDWPVPEQYNGRLDAMEGPELKGAPSSESIIVGQ